MNRADVEESIRDAVHQWTPERHFARVRDVCVVDVQPVRQGDRYVVGLAHDVPFSAVLRYSGDVDNFKFTTLLEAGYDHELFVMGLYTIAQALVMSHDGSSDSLDMTTRDRYVTYLKMRLRAWRDYPMGAFPNAVRALVKAALDDIGETR